jgi:hypothetical protein
LSDWEPYHQDQRDEAAGCLVIALCVAMMAFVTATAILGIGRLMACILAVATIAVQ